MAPNTYYFRFIAPKMSANCACCGKETKSKLECGHGCCAECAENLRALHTLDGALPLCVACGSGGRELGEERAKALLAAIRAAVQRNEEGMTKFEAAEATYEIRLLIF